MLSLIPEGEAQFEADAEDEEQHSISTRLQKNQQYYARTRFLIEHLLIFS